MKKLLVLFFVAAMCVPSYGDIVVYKFTGQFNPWVAFTDDSYETATVGIKKITGYCVSDIDMDTGELNGTPTLIFYEGKVVNYKRYYFIDANWDFTDFYAFDIRGAKGITGRGIYAYITLGDEDTGYWICPLYGKCTLVDIGRVDKRKCWIPRSLKGIMNIAVVSPTPYNAVGNMTMTFDYKYTQNANKTEATQEDTVDKICTDLEGKGYEPGDF